MADTSLNREGLGGQALDVSSRIHDLLLAMAGRIDDDALVRARELLALGEFDRATDFLTGCLVAGAVPVTISERDELSALLVEVRSPPALAARLNLMEQLPTIAHRFTAESEPVAELTEVLSRLAGRLPALNWVRCVSRLTPAGPTPAGGTQRVVLAEVGRSGFPHALAFLLSQELSDLGVSAIVDTWREGSGLSDYHAQALSAAVEVPLPTPAVGPGPSAAASPRSYAAAEPAVSPVSQVDAEPAGRGTGDSHWRSGSGSRGTDWSSRRSVTRSAATADQVMESPRESGRSARSSDGGAEASDDDGGGADRPSWMPRTAPRPDFAAEEHTEASAPLKPVYDAAPAAADVAAADVATADIATEVDETPEVVADVVQLPRPDTATVADAELDGLDGAEPVVETRSRRSSWARRQPSIVTPDNGPELVDEAAGASADEPTRTFSVAETATRRDAPDSATVDSGSVVDLADSTAEPEDGSDSAGTYSWTTGAAEPADDSESTAGGTKSDGGTEADGSADSKLTEKERDLLRKLHEELAQREQVGSAEEPSAAHGGSTSSGRRHAVSNVEQTGPITRITGMDGVSHTAAAGGPHRQNNGYPPFQAPN
ncbi:hypothetical protein FHR81_005393 [Actinoalloteichus hoggarensis]|uniref:Uncharacterized protein n=1 Tax=Actinoalloteichus hoggarensis TaxID=1470176 RepID=A0A221VWL1_9PSEU|nr:hypothetical protein [Actinoalloteichus hoggarensis]ASO17905.1 hypothetical protein AHOG_01195 [Actinoalloteichus hoggarensis]MBB5924316.1 hypothetical protein [Actinoalloteichus hoggarensis]